MATSLDWCWHSISPCKIAVAPTGVAGWWVFEPLFVHELKIQKHRPTLIWQIPVRVWRSLNFLTISYTDGHRLQGRDTSNQPTSRFTPDSKATSQPTTNIEGSLPQPGPTIEHRIGNSPLTALQPPTREGFLFHHTHPLTAHVTHGMAAQPSTRRYVPSALRFSHHLHLQLLPPLSMRERKR